MRPVSALLHPLRVLLAGCMGLVLALAMTMARPWESRQALDGHLFLAGMVLWALSPYGLLWALARRLSAPTPAGRIYPVLAACIGLAWLWPYVDAALVHPDAQGGLVFVFAPLAQWAAVLVLLGLCLFLRLLGRTRGSGADARSGERHGP
jgi:hypothetical protein